jgi:REP element-mobilizing transposase RayT
MNNQEFNTTGYPLAYLFTFRCYGTWLPGDPRGTITKHHRRFETSYLPHDPNWERESRGLLKGPPVELQADMRKCILESIRDTCKIRSWELYAQNARTNHVHAVIDPGVTRPSNVLSALKANATKALRSNGLWQESHSPWAHKGSKRYLWNEEALWKAVEYVIEGQGGELPEF